MNQLTGFSLVKALKTISGLGSELQNFEIKE